MKSFTEIIVAWGRDPLAADLGVPKERVRGWERYNKLPPEHWKKMLEVAPSRDIEITPDLLIGIAASGGRAGEGARAAARN